MNVRTVVNANATLTSLGGSVLAPPVIPAMAEAATRFVDMAELQTHVGERIAELTGNEAAYVTCGAAAAITLTVAACATGTPTALPLHSQVLVFRSQRNGFDYAARMTGAQILEVGPSLGELCAALAQRPACVLWFAGTRYAEGALPLADVVPVARAAGVPVIVDAAAQIPPISSLWHFTVEQGADAVIISGGKGLRGPQSSGLVLGTRQMVEGCRAHASPHYAIGRGMKVGKEELLGLLAAVEWTLSLDEPALLAAYESTVTFWLDGLRDLPGIAVERGYPSEAGQPHGRALIRIGPARDALVEALWNRDPRIAVGLVGDDTIALNPQPLQPGEATLVLDTLRNLVAEIRTES